MTDIAASASTDRQRRNWWKVAFFVALIAFEFAREWAITEAASTAEPAALATVVQVGELVSAEGRWRRIDGDDDLMPNAVSIQCWRNEGKCTEAASNSFNNRYFSTPEINTLDATFTPDAVTYSNNYPCVSYSVRIDLKLQEAFAVREGKRNHPEDMCGALEPRIEMRLGNGVEVGDQTRQSKHFLPLFYVLFVILKAF